MIISTAPKTMSTAFGDRVPLRRCDTVAAPGDRTGFTAREMNRFSNANDILGQDLEISHRARTNSNRRCRSEVHAAFTE